jgi:FKBP-type peptidyl-prolyl cis-trans isomerase FkpA
MRKRCALYGIMLVSLMGCADRPGGGAEESGGAPDEVTFAPAVEVSLERMTRLPSGLYIEDVLTGQGEEARPGQTVVVHYTGWLPDGREFDSSRTRNDPLVFNLGAGEVIAGWDEGVAGMRAGGRRKLVIPPDLAYGADGAGGVIPPNATLVFDVELLDIR